MKFALTGVNEAIDKVRGIGAELSEDNLQRDALESMKPVAADARSLAPVDEGDLRDSIQAEILDDGTAAVVIKDFKGFFWEFGTIHHRAQPMLAPAIDANEDLVIADFGDRIGARIEGAT